MEWAPSHWGVAFLIWFVVSCVFCLALGKIMAQFGGDRALEPHRPNAAGRREPRRVPAKGSRRGQPFKDTGTD